VSSRSSDLRLLLSVGALCLAAACGGSKAPKASRSLPARPLDPRELPQADAELLGRELADIVDRVMSYKSSHRNHLPNSLRQAGLDSLAPLFVRRMSQSKGVPYVTIAFRTTEGHALRSCQGTNAVLEDMSLHDGGFQVSCTYVTGGTKSFTVPPVPPPPK
jgi:hypothetical protein